MALFRALEDTRPASERLFADPYAFQLLPRGLRQVSRLATWRLGRWAVCGLIDRRWPGTRSSGVVRTRLIDDLVSEGLDAGARQLVLLGAGLDCRPYRLVAARHADVFEVDHPATQRAKCSRLGSAALQRAHQVRFVPVDFERDDLADSLLAARYEPRLAAVLLWEGVLSYLTADAVAQTLRAIAGLSCPGSRLVFTYWRRSALEGSVSSTEAEHWMARVRRSGEPFVFGLEPDEVAGYLRPFGFALESNLSTAAAARRYPQAVARREPGSQFYYVASARRR